MANAQPRNTSPVPSAVQPPGVRGRLPLYTPSGLALYACPQRYFLQKIAHRPADEAFSPALARGKATHRVLEAYGHALRRGEATPGNLAARVAAALPRDGYPDERARTEDAAAVLAQVEVGLRHLTAGRRVLAVEAFLRYPYRGDAACPPFVLGASADAILEGVDDRGERFLEVVDWKTGRGRGVDLVQELALRIVAKHTYGEGGYAYIVSTTAFLAEDATWSIVRDDASCRRSWGEMKATVAAIEAEERWVPQASTRCLWCPYFQNGCALDQTDEGGDIGNWLDGAGDGLQGEP